MSVNTRLSLFSWWVGCGCLELVLVAVMIDDLVFSGNG